MGERPAAGGTIELTKHHAAGNDFLVQLDPEAVRQLLAEEVRALCDRRRGVGADGVVRVLRAAAGADLVMDLRNADGTAAEMSGNGIRCMVQAALEAGLVRAGDVVVETPAGIRRVTYTAVEPDLGYATVDMGEAKLQDEFLPEDPPGVRRAVSVDVGNPHLVLLCEAMDDETVRSSGSRLANSVPGGANVEFIFAGEDERSIGLRVYERGVGETLACGTGACAAAAAARSWGLVGSDVEVVMPGGVLRVVLGADHVTLGGPTRKIADVSVSEQDLAALVRELPNRYAGADHGGERKGDMVERV